MNTPAIGATGGIARAQDAGGVRLEVTGLTKAYKGKYAIEEIGFKVRAGEFVAVLGPSGAGKTTLFRCMTGLLAPDRGSVKAGALDVMQLQGRERRHVAVIFQQFNLVNRLSALDNVLAGRLGYVPAWRGWIRRFARADRLLALDCLDRVGLLDKAGQRADTLSGGQQQRVAIARALAQQPDAIVADEPVASLDPKIGSEILDLLRGICHRDGVAVVCSLHQMQFAQTYADRIVGLANGRLIVDMPASSFDTATAAKLYGRAELRSMLIDARQDWQHIRNTMEPVTKHSHYADVSFDGGDLDCGNGLLLLIRKHIDPLDRGGLLEILSTETSVKEDLPAWCRMTKNELVSMTESGRQRSYLVCKGGMAERRQPDSVTTAAAPGFQAMRAIVIPDKLPPAAPAPQIQPFSVMGIGSWPRSRWMLGAMHEHMERRLSDADFQATADDAVRLVVEAQLRAGVDVVTDGEQRRDSYASFVAGILDNCQLIPLTDLLPLVDDPEEFERELRALDVPAGEVRHPAVFGPLGRSKPLAVHELEFVKTLTKKPVKIALPGPYLLARSMWMECISDRAYATREDLAIDIVRVLREELAYLLEAGAALVQFDEPVLTEVVFTGAKTQRSFMCGALSEKGDPLDELAFARDLLNAVVAGFPRERTAVHICRGNWTTDESACLSGSYEPLMDTLRAFNVGTYLLELCTPRAGELAVLKTLPDDRRIGIGVVNQKLDRVESVDEIVARLETAAAIFGPHRILINPDCGFATFADNPVTSTAVAEAKLAHMARAAEQMRARQKC